MKKLLLAFCLCLFATLFLDAQTNTFPSSGNVGIGTTSPSQKLDINEGNINILGYNSSRYIRFTEVNLLGAFINYDGTSNVLKIGVNNIDSANTANDFNAINIVRSTGNVGVGTTTPDARLTVKGNIHTNEVKVDLLGAVAPDYVFYKDYDLKSLKTVEEYIASNGHLPNIPSAKDMETEGIMLKEMNLKLLEKIEELTLYAIDQEKRIDTLEAENKTLKTQEERIAQLEEKLTFLLNKN